MNILNRNNIIASNVIDREFRTLIDEQNKNARAISEIAMKKQNEIELPIGYQFYSSNRDEMFSSQPY